MPKQDRGTRTQREWIADLYAEDPTLIDDNARVREITGLPASSVTRCKSELRALAREAGTDLHTYCTTHHDTIEEDDDVPMPAPDPSPDTGYDTSDTYSMDFDAERYHFRTKGYEWSAPFAMVSDLAWWYTSQGDGRSKRECTLLAREKYQRDLTEDFLAHALRKLGITKHVPPFAPHMLETHTSEELSKLALHRRQAGAEATLRRDEARQWRKIAEEAQGKLRDLDRLADRLGRHIERRRSETKIVHSCLDEGGYTLVAPLGDVHVGKRAGHHGIVQTRDDLMASTCTLVDRVARYGAPDRIIVGLLGDILHIDTDAGTTTRGTPQDVDADPSEIVFAGMDMMIDTIDLWRTLGPVEVVCVPGNHDRVLSAAMVKSLSLYYRGVEDVDVHCDARDRQYVGDASNLYCFHHGDGPKARDLPVIMMSEVPEMVGATTHRYVFSGHLHHVHEHDVGVHILQVPSIAHADRWHTRNGYVTATRATKAFLFDAREGLIGSVTAALPM